MKLFVYELKGGKAPRGLPETGLAAIWPEPPYYYLFYEQDDAGPVLEWLASNPGWQLTSRYELPYESWQDSSFSRIFAGRFIILNSTVDRPTSDIAGRLPILIDPGIVFGSGVHPTTRGCLTALSELFESERIRTAVDFGTGTGILAVACTLLGAPHVLAVDCKLPAVANARRNAADNGVADQIGLIVSDRLDVLRPAADLLLMNLEWPILEGVLRTDAWKSYRLVVLSGFLESRLEPLIEVVRPWFEPVRTAILDGWPTVTLARNAGEESRI